MFSKNCCWRSCTIFAIVLVFAFICINCGGGSAEPQILASYLLLNADSDGDAGHDVRERRAITLPFAERSLSYRDVCNSEYEYTVALDWNWGGNTRFRVIPDDSLESIAVNGVLMPEERYSEPGRRDYRNGLIVDFGGYLRPGRNEIRFLIADNGGKYGMNLTKENQDSPDSDSPRIQESFLRQDGGERRAITLPFAEQSPVYRVAYEYIVELAWREGDKARFRVIPDDYLESIMVNGRLMPEERYPEPGRSDYRNGLVVDFGSYLRDGKNEIHFKIIDTGGAYGLNVLAAGDSEGSPLLSLFLITVLCLGGSFSIWYFYFRK